MKLRAFLLAVLLTASLAGAALAQVSPGGVTGVRGSGSAGYPPGAVPVTAAVNAADTTSLSVSLPAAAGKFTYICGFVAQSNGVTTPTTTTVQVGTLVSGSLFSYIFELPGPVSNSTFVQQQQNYTPCIPANAQNATIGVLVGGGAGNTSTAINAWGYQQ